MGAVSREPGWGSFARGPDVYEREAMGRDISLWGSVWYPGVGSSTVDFEIWLKGALELECLCGKSLKGNWRALLLGTLEVYCSTGDLRAE
jgi:hypothetical protein